MVEQKIVIIDIVSNKGKLVIPFQSIYASLTLFLSNTAFITIPTEKYLLNQISQYVT